MKINFTLLAQIFKCLADETRLKILYHISQKERSVTAISENLNLSQPLVSHHLKILRDNFLVKMQRKGAFVYYVGGDENILNLINKLNAIAYEKAAKKFLMEE